MICLKVGRAMFQRTHGGERVSPEVDAHICNLVQVPCFRYTIKPKLNILVGTNKPRSRDSFPVL